MIELTEEQRQQLTQPGPINVRDPSSGRIYVLVPTEVYQRLEALLDDDVRLMEPLLVELAPEDWEDPANYEPTP
jgi:hypothetical protein